MEVLGAYTTKAKWQLRLDKEFPQFGYYGLRYRNADPVYLPAGFNVLLYGTVGVRYTERGRSAARFAMETDGFSAPMSLTGMLKLLNFVTAGESTMKPSGDDFEGPMFTGYWTTSKQGQDVFLIPSAKILLNDLDRIADLV